MSILPKNVLSNQNYSFFPFNDGSSDQKLLYKTLADTTITYSVVLDSVRIYDYVRQQYLFCNVEANAYFTNIVSFNERERQYVPPPAISLDEWVKSDLFEYLWSHFFSSYFTDSLFNEYLCRQLNVYGKVNVAYRNDDDGVVINFNVIIPNISLKTKVPTLLHYNFYKRKIAILGIFLLILIFGYLILLWSKEKKIN